MTSTVGPIILDLLGLELDAEERELLQHPLIGGVIFFARNFYSPEQLRSLCKEIRACRKHPILLTVDQEGGRVQRFVEGFTQLPSLSEIGNTYLHSPEKAMHLATSCGWLMAAELINIGIDLSFAPVLDLDKGISTVIGNRAFHRDINIVTHLSKAFIQGMRTAGMAAVGKHFPGHGSVSIDSHLGLPQDLRSIEEIEIDDLIPFKELIASGIEGIMAAHIHFPLIDNNPVSFSVNWLQKILRQKLHFSGMIFSDALDMRGADIAGGFPERIVAALEAGCDMVLLCNSRANVIKTLDELPAEYRPVDDLKFNKMRGNFSAVSQELKKSEEWKYHRSRLDRVSLEKPNIT